MVTIFRIDYILCHIKFTYQKNIGLVFSGLCIANLIVAGRASTKSNVAIDSIVF